MKKPKYIDDRTGRVRDTLKIKPVPEPEDVYKTFQGGHTRRSSEQIYDDDDTMATGSVRQNERILPSNTKPPTHGKVRKYTKKELKEYEQNRHE